MAFCLITSSSLSPLQHFSLVQYLAPSDPVSKSICYEVGSDNPPEVSTSAGGGQTVGLHPWSPPRYQGPARKGSFSHADALKEPLPREQV
ncbi:hypothetical protein Pcinc_019716 [Petrolisthes cinctipes]|uniref:Uncharacterized protein n=1 Tax=Petrolisthes cinctipes TaxID=88211 RepID=A0AAE1FJK6_PETCI|nr:hypothetical protein Pcinc_019716 [Petrolisthes cinctipes]